MLSAFCFDSDGRHLRFNGMPQGWNSSACIFHSYLRNIFRDMKGINYMDDIIIVGATIEEHNRNVDALMQKLDQFGPHSNSTKTQFRQRVVEYLGYTITEGHITFDHFEDRAAWATEVDGRVLRALGFLLVNFYP